MKSLSSFIILLAFLSLPSLAQTTAMISPGKVGDIQVFKSSLDDVKKQYGKKFTKTKTVGFTCPSGNCDFTNQHAIEYAKKGVTFVFKSLGKKADLGSLQMIRFTEMFKGKTQKGIELGKSTVKDVIDAYGWGVVATKPDGELILMYEGIYFSVNTNKNFQPNASVDLRNHFEEKVTSLTVTNAW